MEAKNFTVLGGSPDLVVMGGDLCPRGCEFGSECCILDGSFFTFICCKSCIENQFKRRPRMAHFLKMSLCNCCYGTNQEHFGLEDCESSTLY